MKHLFACLLLTLAACTTTGMVATATFDGQGGVWSDGVALVALGEYEGHFSVFGKDTGIEIIFPLQVQDGQVYIYNRLTGEEAWLDDAEPLPAWTASLFRPGEADALGLTFLAAE